MDYFADKSVYDVQPISGPVSLSVAVPGSKSITNRALLLAALAEGTSVLKGTLFSDDSRHFLACLQELGFPVKIDEAGRTVTVTGFGGKIPKREASIYVGSAGTAARFLTAMLGLSDGTYHLNSSEQMKKRPMKPLLDSLASIGVTVTYAEKEGFFPFTIHGSFSAKNSIEVDIGSSSQFLSALLMSAPMKAEGLTIS
ncbi:MAG: 3-phosphoshikimate 1-carboxyvinyltransferase, partial [Lachnospiraceae bacterium]|nr:3-phosphoshikimate 1-carboxyvinyltransferase [Lachnospiraceae bacterium]